MTNLRVLPVDGPAAPDGIVSIDDRDALDRAFRRLTVEQRAVFVLHHHVGLPLVEIADYQFPVTFNATTRAYFTEMAKITGGATGIGAELVRAPMAAVPHG